MDGSDTDELPAACIGNFTAALDLSDVPETGVATAKRCFLDTIGVSIAGANDDAGATVVDAIVDLQGTTDATSVLGRETRLTALDSAFVNGTAAHALDFDDVVSGIHIHPSAPLVPAVLAVGEHVDASGTDALEAFVAGFEAQYAVARPVTPAHYERGWHATATFGTFGATAAAAKLLFLSAEQTGTALETAASMVAGLKKNFGSMAKPMHPGNAARAGVTAATLANHGFTAMAGSLGGDGGFFDLYAGDEDADLAAFPNLGERWAIAETGVDVKKYPSCYFTHSSIAAMESLVEAHGFGPEDVEAVTVSASPGARQTVVYDRPESGLQGKFSMPYTVASAVTRDRVGIDAFTDEAVTHEPTRSLLERIHFEGDSALEYSSHATTVTVQLTDGTTLRESRDHPPGTADDPLSDEELRTKFHHCSERVYGEADVATLRERIDSLEECETLSDLFRDLPPG
jgi:2-methylcitrate dehydratase PrpD